MSTASNHPSPDHTAAPVEQAGSGAPGIAPRVDTLVRLGEFHTFEAAGERFGYMVPSAAVFAFDPCASALSDALEAGPRTIGDLVTALDGRFDAGEVWDTLGELYRVRAIAEAKAPAPPPKILPLTPSRCRRWC